MKKLLILMVLGLMACADVATEQSDDLGESMHALTTSYGNRVHNSSGPFAAAVGSEATQYLPFKQNIGQGSYPPCNMPLGSCNSVNYHKYYFDPATNPLGYATTWSWGNPSAAPAGSVGNLNVRLCLRLLNNGFDTVAYDLGCTDVSSLHSGGTNTFNGSPNWGNILNFATVKGLYPEFRLIYKFLPTLASPAGTPCNSCVIPNNTVTIYHRQVTYP